MTEFIIVNKFRFTWLYKLKKELWKITSLYKKVSHVARVGSDKRRNSSMQLNGCGRVLRIDYSLPAAEAAVGNAGAVAVQSDRRFRVNVLIPTCCWCCLAVRILLFVCLFVSSCGCNINYTTEWSYTCRLTTTYRVFAFLSPNIGALGQETTSYNS